MASRQKASMQSMTNLPTLIGKSCHQSQIRSLSRSDLCHTGCWGCHQFNTFWQICWQYLRMINVQMPIDNCNFCKSANLCNNTLATPCWWNNLLMTPQRRNNLIPAPKRQNNHIVTLQRRVQTSTRSNFRSCPTCQPASSLEMRLEEFRCEDQVW